MNNHILNHSLQTVCKDSYFKTQSKIIFDEFFKQPRTMKELSVITGIDRSNICWFCREMRKNKSIAVYNKVYCSITKHKANRYTTNPQLFNINPQLTLSLCLL